MFDIGSGGVVTDSSTTGTRGFSATVGLACAAGGVAVIAFDGVSGTVEPGLT